VGILTNHNQNVNLSRSGLTNGKKGPFSLNQDNMASYRMRLAKGLRKYIQSITISALKDYSFYQYTALAVGASSIAVSRIINNIKPAWPEHLENLSWIKFDDIDRCTKKLLQLISQNQKISNDSLLSKIDYQSLNKAAIESNSIMRVGYQNNEENYNFNNNGLPEIATKKEI